MTELATRIDSAPLDAEETRHFGELLQLIDQASLCQDGAGYALFQSHEGYVDAPELPPEKQIGMLIFSRYQRCDDGRLHLQRAIIEIAGEGLSILSTVLPTDDPAQYTTPFGLMLIDELSGHLADTPEKLVVQVTRQEPDEPPKHGWHDKMKQLVHAFKTVRTDRNIGNYV